MSSNRQNFALYGNRGQQIEFWCERFHRKLINRRFCARALKRLLKVAVSTKSRPYHSNNYYNLIFSIISIINNTTRLSLIFMVAIYSSITFAWLKYTTYFDSTASHLCRCQKLTHPHNSVSLTLTYASFGSLAPCTILLSPTSIARA